MSFLTKRSNSNQPESKKFKVKDLFIADAEIISSNAEFDVPMVVEDKFIVTKDGNEFIEVFSGTRLKVDKYSDLYKKMGIKEDNKDEVNIESFDVPYITEYVPLSECVNKGVKELSLEELFFLLNRKRASAELERLNSFERDSEYDDEDDDYDETDFSDYDFDESEEDWKAKVMVISKGSIICSLLDDVHWNFIGGKIMDNFSKIVSNIENELTQLKNINNNLERENELLRDELNLSKSSDDREITLKILFANFFLKDGSKSVKTKAFNDIRKFMVDNNINSLKEFDGKDLNYFLYLNRKKHTNSISKPHTLAMFIVLLEHYNIHINYKGDKFQNPKFTMVKELIPEYRKSIAFVD